MKYRTINNEFTQEEFDAGAHLFYALPGEWGQGSPRPSLADLWKRGGAGTIAALPVLGLYARFSFAKRLRLPVEKIARLSGIAPSTLQRGARVLSELGLADRRRSSWHGRSLTEWSLNETLAVDPGPNGRLSKNYFYFSGRLVFGGNWARLTTVQRAVYLGVATRAWSFRQPPDENDLLQDSLPSTVGRSDFHAAFEADPAHPVLRLAVVSYRELAQVTGISPSSLKEAVKLLKRPEGWSVAAVDDEQLIHAPLAVYPTDGGSLLYHFRDHAPPWCGITSPAPRERRAPAVAPAGEATPRAESPLLGAPQWLYE